jgi:trimeric autotransporter adhesin
MSTKTTFKRIALVAVAALGLGVLSVAPSSAVVSGLSVTVTNGTAGLVGAQSDTTTGALISVSALLDGGRADTITVGFVQKSAYPTGASTVVPVLQFIETSTGTGTSVDISSPFAAAERNTFSASESVTASGLYGITETSTGAAYVGANFRLMLDSISSTTRPAGTYSYSIIVKTYNAGTLDKTNVYDANIVVAAAAADSETPSAAYTTAYLNSATGQTTDTAGISKLATASTVAAAYLPVSVNNAANGAAAIDTVTVSITGPGLLYNGSSYGKSLTELQTGLKEYTIVPDGVAGVSTITVKTTVTGMTFTKSMSFYAAAAKTITASAYNPVLAAGDNASAIAVSAVDANGTPWTGTAYIVASSAADALIAGSTTPVACAAYNTTTGILCPVTAATVGTAKLKVIDASTVALATATSNEVTVTVKAQIAASVKIAFDKASYAPNEKALITVTPVDAAGASMQGKTWTNLLATGGITSTSAFAAGSMDSLTATGHITEVANGTNKTAGAYTFVVYMPSASGDVTISATGGSTLPAAGQVALTATASVVNASVDAATDAANEATDAANAATDAALAAADAADAATDAAQDASDAVAALSASVSKLISSLRAQITSLTNLVIKIQKKVKA